MEFNGGSTDPTTIYVAQNVDLTNVNNISFWGYGGSTGDGKIQYFYIYIDGVRVRIFQHNSDRLDTIYCSNIQIHRSSPG